MHTKISIEKTRLESQEDWRDLERERERDIVSSIRSSLALSEISFPPAFNER